MFRLPGLKLLTRPVRSFRAHTIRMMHASRVAFASTSRSTGNWMPKLSASVNISRANPAHCFDSFPMTCSPSALSTCSSAELLLYCGYYLSICMMHRSRARCKLIASAFVIIASQVISYYLHCNVGAIDYVRTPTSNSTSVPQQELGMKGPFTCRITSFVPLRMLKVGQQFHTCSIEPIGRPPEETAMV